MDPKEHQMIVDLIRLYSKPHPWHGIKPGTNPPERVNVFIEIVPGDTMKYELDKESGYLKIDRPQRFSNIVPVPYGFIPRTYCSTLIGEYCMNKTGRKGIVGDHDPLDICVVTERNIPHGDLFLEALPVGGLRMIDGEEADDKIIAVMRGDALYGDIENIGELPESLIERLSHYFLTYKQSPFTEEKAECEITDVYDKEEAQEIIRRSMVDYENSFDSVKQLRH